MYDSHPSCHGPCLWANFDFGMLLQLSATMRTCYFGQNSPGICHFWPNLGVSITVNGVFGWKNHGRFPSQALQTFLMNQFWLWTASAAVCKHPHMWFGPNQPWSCSFLAKTGGQLGRKYCGWPKMTPTIPVPGFVINVCELILTLECFWNSLQSCTYAIWAKVALKLFIFGQIWGSVWH